ncbi:MAG: hypothetical protein H6718_34095 [Polyangiaceae bacterium]|nr:hypothetical protein [Myxococcales bacterium]MCB9590492.1 hypothetical protein [Polyangiaceae bacterium]MCB9608485.1 hypothetical protein [Polyangiaceae bacterium]
MRTLAILAWVTTGLICSSACSSDNPAKSGADAGADVSSAGNAGSAGEGGIGGSGGSGGATPDASDDGQAGSDAMDAATDPFADAPPRPDLNGPMQIVLFGELDGIDVTGTYDQDPGSTVCGEGFTATREDGVGGSVVISWQDDMTTLVPTVGDYDARYGFDITVTKFVRIDDTPKQVSFRAGQTYPGSTLSGNVSHSDLIASGTLEAFFEITSAERVVDSNEGLKSGQLYLWVAGSCQ